MALCIVLSFFSDTINTFGMFMYTILLFGEIYLVEISVMKQLLTQNQSNQLYERSVLLGVSFEKHPPQNCSVTYGTGETLFRASNDVTPSANGNQIDTT